jgi:subtilase family serine protease
MISNQVLLAAPSRMSGHVPEAVLSQSVRLIGPLPATQMLDVAVGLPLRNRDELDRLLRELVDPASPNYRRFLSVEEFTQRFGPTADDYAAVMRFAAQQHLTVTTTHKNRLVIDLHGSVQSLERALHTNLAEFQHPTENRTFFAPSVEPMVDSGLPILHISGLDNFAPPHPASLHRTARRVSHDANGSGPGSGYIGGDFRAAYAPGVTLDGSGQSIGLFEFGAYKLSDVQQWFATANLPINVPIKNIVLNNISPICGKGCDDGEAVLDIEMAISMAPGLSQLLVYEGSNATDILNRMATDNIAKQLSCSFGWLPPDPNQEQIFQEYQAQGQNFFVATGDTGAISANNPVTAPGDDPNVVTVGGTSLSTVSPGGPWQSETAWNASQGGISSNNFPLPSYQIGVINAANQGSKTLRNIPDVSSDADTNIYAGMDPNNVYYSGGTSAAAPTWAGFMALVNQQAAMNGRPPVGFLNPTLYMLGRSANYGHYFHDVTSGNNFTKESPKLFTAVRGYDLVTGWGSPTGQAMIDALAGPPVAGPDMAVGPDKTFGADLAIGSDLASSAGTSPNGGNGNGGSGVAGVGATGMTDSSGGCSFAGDATVMPLPLMLAFVVLIAWRRRNRV